MVYPNTYVRRYVEEGKHNFRYFPDITVAGKGFPSSLVRKKILEF
jgi:hypothetical protein